MKAKVHRDIYRKRAAACKILLVNAESTKQGTGANRHLPKTVKHGCSKVSANAERLKQARSSLSANTDDSKQHGSLKQQSLFLVFTQLFNLINLQEF